MNCDNNEFMFGRDLVRCVMQNINPAWNPSSDFRQLQNNSPFTAVMGVALRTILLRDEPGYVTRIRTEIGYRPLTVGFYRELTELNFNYYSLVHAIDRKEHLKFFLMITIRAYYFMLNCSEGNFDTMAADTISRFLFKLQHEGHINANVWAEYETVMKEKAGLS